MQSTWKRSPSSRSRRADDVRDGAADAGVDLVEDERLARRVGRRERLQRQHDPRQLAARGDARQRAARPRRGSARCRTRPRRGPAPSTALPRASSLREADLAARPGHREIGRAPSRAPGELLRRGPAPAPRDRRRPAGRPAAAGRAPRRARRRARSRARCRAARGGASSPFAMTSASAGPCFFFRRSSSASRSSISCSRAGDASMFSRVRPQEEREILELRLDRVARLDVRRELRDRARPARRPASTCRPSAGSAASSPS